MNTVEVTCATCGQRVNKPKNEYNRRIRKGCTRFFCSATCCGNHPDNIKHVLEIAKLSPINIQEYAGNRKDIYSSFRYFTRRIRVGSGKRYGESDITDEFLKELYDGQLGKCKLSGVVMTLPTTTKDKRTKPTDASLDRIDSNRGYTKDNVQFICQFINLGKREFTDAVVLDFLKLIRNEQADK